jgi:hypothetical protein
MSVSPMTRLVCPRCDGRQHVWQESVLFECPRCLGSGWVSLPSELHDPRRIVEAALAFFAVLALVIVASVQ